ncbi:DUF3108 domain-containing protein [Geomesophilobacter sediminis]|uniref:DUF3108 domain-containing protein n=1 Tax=Geomesophilobacter sediminis TaxID=2798584 RepID=A0A8J7M3J0_9BACT|nr:DUF3108 domain-containing protein [Geomesophilobacter sediminis]MBJ6727929.1 DUF3108 domain-containing protein [Geomesophilobacter sediminis]
MFKLFRNLRRISYCVVLSLAAHLLVAYAFRFLGSYDFGAAVNPPCITVSLAEALPEAKAPVVVAPKEEAAPKQEQPPAVAPVAKKTDAEPDDDAPVVPPAPAQPAPKVPVAATEPPPIKKVKEEPAAPAPRPAVAQAPPANAKPVAVPTAVAGTGSYFSAQYEKLTYQITKLGIPVGSAELESKNENGVTSVGLRIKTNLAFSAIFPVDDVIETNRIDGRFINTSIRQREGSFRADEMFTINMQKRTVAWNDLVHGRRQKLDVPTTDVVDSLTGIYYLRNRPLEVGKNEVMHVYDSEIYAEVPVEVLRKEEIRLPNLAKVATIVVRPLQKTAGMFRRTGDMLIWMTDDQNRVPVKIETTVAVGRVTAELLSSETTPHGKPDDGKKRLGSAANGPIPWL